MAIWILALIALAALAGVVWAVINIKKKGMDQVTLVLILGVIGTAAALLLTLGLVHLNAPEPVPTFAETTAVQTDAPETTTVTEAPTLPPMPEDWDLPVSELPEELPDIHRAADLEYVETPYFARSMDLSQYLLHCFLNGRFKMDFYLSRELAPGEGEAYAQISSCIDSALCYYTFGAYQEYSLYIEEVGDPEFVLAHVDLRYEHPEYDLEARAEALEYVLKHPVPIGGFRDAAQEREYCRGIHDYLIARISYDPIGYGSVEMLNQSQYDNKQEAYNALVSEDTSAVCAGYARGFALIAQYAGIDCAYVTGNEVTEPEPESHAWNVIYPCDGGEPVLVDVTWDDPDLLDDQGNAICNYGYFYIPLDIDTEHTMRPDISHFLDWIHDPW